MTRRHKILLIAFFVLCAGAGYAVYWWHETSLDRIALEHVSYHGPALDEVRKLLDVEKPAEARARLDRLPRHEKVGILKVLDRDTDTMVRMFAVRYMRSMRDVPAIRAELARIAQDDQDRAVSRLASRALQGRR